MRAKSDLPVALLMGPTAAGKTDIAVRLVEQANMEIISVDSALIYRGMDIGTAKPDAETLQRAPHFLIDIRDPSEAYSAAEFVSDASRLITEIHARGNIPLLCGGTMLYFRAVTEGLSELPKADEAIRQALIDEAEEKGWQVMHAELEKIDPQAATRIHQNDPQRIQRALEIYRITGISMSDWLQQNRPRGLDYHFIRQVVAPQDRSVLHQRIEQRFDLMLKQGLIDEVEGLRARGDLDLGKPSMRSVGYRQIWQYLDGEYRLEEARLKGIYATRQLAKRQLTWLRAVQGAQWYDPQDSSNIERLMGEFSIKA
ncbi:MAG: tRNA (adenosine(37)-N6)-dimethylallyltransferase MiaA [Gammaproteobacteria bacterium]|nr:tRNA (adenosine(37)-N6)-dimethylallyltransferase MiaA [Gammaproteobacteria bacterium]